MKYIGVHVPAAEGVASAPVEAAALGAQAFAFIPGVKDRWTAAMPGEAEIVSFKSNCERYGFTPAQILPHANLLINLAGTDARKLAMSRRSLRAEMEICNRLGLTMLNFHAGAHLRLSTVDEACHRIADGINDVLSRTEGVIAVVENSAAQGTSVGFDFVQLRRILDGVEDKTRIGVCIDTCHAFSAGYDFSTAEGYQRVWSEFADTVGFDYLRGVHLNDDARPCGSHIDRHASIGRGTIGREFFELFMHDPRFDGIPIILETPDPALWREEIEYLRSLSLPASSKGLV